MSSITVGFSSSLFPSPLLPSLLLFSFFIFHLFFVVHAPWLLITLLPFISSRATHACWHNTHTRTLTHAHQRTHTLTNTHTRTPDYSLSCFSSVPSGQDDRATRLRNGKWRKLSNSWLIKVSWESGRQRRGSDEPTLSTFLSWSSLQPPHTKARSLAFPNISVLGSPNWRTRRHVVSTPPFFWQGL